MIEYKLLSKLSENLLEVLNKEEYYDITIKVGNEPYTKIFRAHMAILNCRSPYFRRILSTNEKDDGALKSNIKLQNILPETFQVILRYLYCGKLSLGKYDTLDIINILVAANEFNLQELISYLQSFLIEKKANWLEQNFDLIYQISFKDDTFLELQSYCTDLISREPDKVFKSPNFSSIPEKLLVLLVQNENLQLSAIQVWEHVIKWGIAQNKGLPSDPTSYSKEDFNKLRNTLQQCIHFIRFHHFTSKEFSNKVLPYRRSLPKNLYTDLLKDFLENDYKPTMEREPRISKEFTNSKYIEIINSENIISKIIDSKNVESESIDPKIIDSKVISIRHAELISKWINRLNIMDNLTFIYGFKLIYRGSRDGLSPKKFHEFCDNKFRTVTIIKAEDCDEILGGYNPISWGSDPHFGITKDSFIFSFKDNSNIANHVLSRVINEKKATNNKSDYGPTFGKDDLHLYQNYLNQEFSIFCSYSKKIYERPIRVSSGFVGCVREIEVFQIV